VPLEGVQHDSKYFPQAPWQRLGGGGMSSTVSSTRSISEVQKLFLTRLAEDCGAEHLVIPSFPDVTLRIRNLADAADSTLNQLVAAVSLEPVLAAQVLRLANSALYRQSGPAETSLARAIQRLGMAELRDIAVMFGMRQLSLAPTVAPFRDYLREVWEHSLLVAQAARFIAQHARMANAGSAQLAGLLHDLGKFYVVLRAQDYPELLEAGKSLASIAADWHCPVGRALLEGWGLPLPVQLVAEEHEDLERDPIRLLPDLTDVVAVANALANRGEGTSDEKLATLLATASGRRLHLDSAGLRTCFKAASEAAEEARRAFPSL